MSKLFQRLFGRRAATNTDALAPAPTVLGANALDDGEGVEQEYKELCQTFYFKPGQLLVDYLSTQKVTRLLDWLQPNTPELEPKAFIRFMVISVTQRTQALRLEAR